VLRQSCARLHEMGHSVEVVCLDAPDAPWLRDFPAQVHAIGPAKGKYGFSGRFIPWLRRHAADYRAVIVDGIWQFPSLGTWLALRKSKTPYFVVSHGMLDPSFKSRYPLKHLKKQVYWLFAAYWILRRARAVFYTSQQEKVLARKSFWPYRAKEAVVGLGCEEPLGDMYHQRQLFFNTFPKLRDKRLILFLGRLHPHKGCDLLIEAFAQLAHYDPRLHLLLVGPDESGWQKKLQRRVVELGLRDRVTFTGMLMGDVKWGTFSAAEVLMLPSHSESFGLVVAEAMAYGVPVLISDKVNIWREVESTGGGFVASDDLSGALSLLDKWLRLTPHERQSMKSEAQKGFSERFSLHAALEEFISVLHTLSVAKDSGSSRICSDFSDSLKHR
jgi:glycosyltransferase involved in cell wall biosynthesis